MDALPKRRSNVHERVQRESRNASAEKVVNARLRYPTSECSFFLSPASLVDEFGNLVHEFGTHTKICSLLGRISDSIPYARVSFA